MRKLLVIVPATLTIVLSGRALPTDPAQHISIHFVDAAKRPVSGVTVGRKFEATDWRVAPGQPALEQWRVSLSTFQVVTSDATGSVSLDVDALFGKANRPKRVILYALSKDHRNAAIFPVTIENLTAPVKVTVSPACHVAATITSTDLVAMDRKIERAFLRIFAFQTELMDLTSTRGRFDFWLPEGNFRYQASGRGTSGASVTPQFGEIKIAAGENTRTVGPLDLHSGKLAALLDKPAPEFVGLTTWRNGAPVTLAELRGKVVILDFWNWPCTQCCLEMPTLFDMQKKYADKGLVVIGVHVIVPTTPEFMDGKIKNLVDRVWKRSPPFRIALDPKANGPMAAAYGVTAVPAIILIDRSGKLVTKAGNPADPQFQKLALNLINSGN